MKKKILIGLGVLVVLVGIFAFSLPTILKKQGLHPDYADSKVYDLKGKKALIITTSHGILNKAGETKGKKTGVFTLKNFNFNSEICLRSNIFLLF